MLRQMFDRTRDDKLRFWSCGGNFLLLSIIVGTILFKAFQGGDCQYESGDFCRWNVHVDGIRPDHIKHFGAFLLLGVFLYRGFTSCFSRPTECALVATCLGGLSFGFLIEVVQPCVGRCCDMSDVVADALGILLGPVLWGVVRCGVDRITSPRHWLRNLM